MAGGSKPYKTGRNFEYLVKKKLVAAGFIVTRTYASRGSYDLHATRKSTITDGVVGGYASITWLVQAKKDGRIDPEERARLIQDAGAHGCVPVMAFSIRPTRFVIVNPEGKGAELEVEKK